MIIKLAAVRHGKKKTVVLKSEDIKAFVKDRKQFKNWQTAKHVLGHEKLKGSRMERYGRIISNMKHKPKDVGELASHVARSESGKKMLGAMHMAKKDAKRFGKTMMANKGKTALVVVPLAALIGAKAVMNHKKHKEDMQIPEYLR